MRQNARFSKARLPELNKREQGYALAWTGSGTGMRRTQEEYGSHAPEPLVKPERVAAIKSFRRGLALLEEAYGLKLTADTDVTGDILIVDQIQKLPADYEWSAYIGADGTLEIAEWVLEEESGIKHDNVVV